MSKFEELHADVLEVCPGCQRYVDRNIKGYIVEAWQKDENGVWHDITLREQEKERLERQLAAAKRDLSKLEVTV